MCMYKVVQKYEKKRQKNYNQGGINFNFQFIGMELGKFNFAQAHRILPLAYRPIRLAIPMRRWVFEGVDYKFDLIFEFDLSI